MVTTACTFASTSLSFSVSGPAQAGLARTVLWGPNPFFFLFPYGICDQLLFAVDSGWNHQ